MNVIAERLQLFSDRYNPFVDTAASVYPFVPEDIYAEFDTCMKVALIEIRHIQEDPSKVSRRLASTGATKLCKSLTLPTTRQPDSRVSASGICRSSPTEVSETNSSRVFPVGKPRVTKAISG
jgi:hypothetical protein